MEEERIAAITPGTEETAAAEKPDNKKRKNGGFVLLLVQSLVAILLVLFGWLFRLIGGSAFDGMRAELQKALTDNTIVEAVLSLWVPPVKEKSDDPAASSGVTSSTATSTTSTETKAMAAGEQPVAIPCLPLSSGTLTSGYGMRLDPVDGVWSFHKGWDIAAAENSPIAAVCGGTVAEVNEGGDYGRTLLVQCGERNAFRYAHCSRILVKEGDRVKAGETVATVGRTGKATGSHLHIEWLVGGVPRSPALLFGGDPYA